MRPLYLFGYNRHVQLVHGHAICYKGGRAYHDGLVAAAPQHQKPDATARQLRLQGVGVDSAVLVQVVVYC